MCQVTIDILATQMLRYILFQVSFRFSTKKIANKVDIMMNHDLLRVEASFESKKISDYSQTYEVVRREQDRMMMNLYVLLRTLSF